MTVNSGDNPADMPSEDLLRRLPATMNHATALKDIHYRLAHATNLIDQDEREGVWRALNDVINYLSSQGLPMATLQPLMAVTSAIVDADRGIESAIFKPAKKSGRPPNSTSQIVNDQLLAVIAECCVRHERALGERDYLDRATRLAAQLVNSSKDGVRKTGAEMANVREKIRQLPANDTRRTLFDDFLDGRIVAEAPLAWARMLVEHEWIRTL